MPQCVKTLKIGSVLLKTGVFKDKKKPAQFFKSGKNFIVLAKNF